MPETEVIHAGALHGADVVEIAKLLLFVFATAGIGRLVWLGGSLHQMVLGLVNAQTKTNGSIADAVAERRRLVDQNNEDHRYILKLIHDLSLRIAGVPCLGVRTDDCPEGGKK